MRTNLEHSNLTRPRITGLSHSNVVTTLTGTFVVPADGPGVHVLNGGLLDRTVRLPLRQYENQIVIANNGATNALNITDSSGVSQVSLPPQSAAIFFGTPTRWIWIFTNFSAASDIIPTVYATSSNILATDAKVQTTQIGAIVLTLPAAVAWAAANKHGNPLTIFDTTGFATANNVVINAAVGESISGGDSITISTDFGGYGLEPIAGGAGWLVVLGI